MVNCVLKSVPCTHVPQNGNLAAPENLRESAASAFPDELLVIKNAVGGSCASRLSLRNKALCSKVSDRL